MPTRSALALVFSSLIFCFPVTAQNASPAEKDQPVEVIHSTRREVLVDLVVRDKHQRLIGNLRPDEVELYEDGVRQKVNAFRRVGGAEQLQSEKDAPKEASSNLQNQAPTDPAASTTSVKQLNFVSVVMAEIAPLNLRFANEAVHDFLNSGDFPNTYVSIYRLNRSLSVMQFYTADKNLLGKALDSTSRSLGTHDNISTDATVIGSAFATLQSLAENILSSPNSDATTQLAVRNALLDPFPTLLRSPQFARNAASMDVSVTLGNAILAQARIENGLKFATSLSNGMDALDALREIVRSQENLPGRKVVLYLADGLDFPINRQDAVESLISYANRAGVAFYTVDTRGLKMEDPMMRSIAELERTAAVSSTQRINPVTGHKQDDDMAVSIQSNRQLSLRELAESTGGFAISNTNEIAGPMQRVMEDIRSHYELAYTPTSSSYDGRFRKIEVKVRRNHVTIQSRKGYFALPDVNGKPLLPFEANSLNAINNRTSVAALRYNVAILKFRPMQNRVEHQVAFEIPLSSLSAKPDHTGKSAVRASMFALIRNQSGEIVGKVGREVTRNLPIDDQSSKERGKDNDKDKEEDRIVFAEPVELPPGHYVMDTAVSDEWAGKTAVKRVAFYVPTGEGFGLSSLELVRDRDNSPAQSSMALAASENRTLPILADSVSSARPVYLYFVLYPSKLLSQPKVLLQVLHDGREIARRTLNLPEAKPDGSVPVMLKLAPEQGNCDIVVTAQQEELSAQSALSVNVQ